MGSRADLKIQVFADWFGDGIPRLMGTLNTLNVKGKEVFSFEYDANWLDNNKDVLILDPHLGFFKGRQYIPDGKANFGIFLDTAPDRWGRMLMRRREAVLARSEGRAGRTLLESDYLLGVYDGHRSGALRFRLDAEGDFLNNNKEMASPPWASLRELEYASLQIEREDAMEDPAYNGWLRLLVDPGSSLGGARPKASVVDAQGCLWIAKFPSSQDEKDTAAWEMVLNRLAARCGINVPETKLLKLSGRHHTFLSKRFDRDGKGRRIHFASAMALLGFEDGDDFNTGAGYLDLVAFITRFSPRPKYDLEQLWRRILFNVLVSNTDDHLRNHGFILREQGWTLSPAFDMNPNPYGNGLTLNITEHSNALDISLLLDCCRHFRLRETEAIRIISEMQDALSNWRLVAREMGIGRSEIEETKAAFALLKGKTGK